LKIANWNIQRLKHSKQLGSIKALIEKQNADIVVLTEADMRLELSEYPYRFETEPLEQPFYKPTERRVIIHSMFPSVGKLETFNPQTACCPILETSLGTVAIYGTIIGIYGNHIPPFKEDLQSQIIDWNQITKEHQLCVAGDFNISFSDGYYFTHHGRNSLFDCFKSFELKILTSELPECIDHIALTRSFLGSNSVKLNEWNMDKSLSDHKGVCVELVKLLTGQSAF
jgi:endonuclease/exonuclease/phosphatase family metal-dependent hydrolase